MEHDSEPTFDVRLQFDGSGHYEIFAGISSISLVTDQTGASSGTAVLCGPRTTDGTSNVIALVPLYDARYLSRVDNLAPEDRE